MTLKYRFATIAILLPLCLAGRQAEPQYMSISVSNDWQKPISTSVGTLAWEDTRLGPVRVYASLAIKYYFSTVYDRRGTGGEVLEKTGHWDGHSGIGSISTSLDILAFAHSRRRSNSGQMFWQWHLTVVVTDAVYTTRRDVYSTWRGIGIAP